MEPINFDLLSIDAMKSQRVGLSKEDIKSAFLENLFFGIGGVPKGASMKDFYTALSLTIRDRIFKEFVQTTKKIAEKDLRVVAYLSAEYLPGPHLSNSLLGLGITDQTSEGMKDLGLSLDDILAQDEEPGLGNGGLGRLASCYLDSMATLGIPSIAYGIRYEFGIFNQQIIDGWQAEYTDKWLKYGNPWEIIRPEIEYEVKFGGYTYHKKDDQDGKYTIEWHPESVVIGTAYDTPVIGYKGSGSILRLWTAGAVDSFDFGAYNMGDYYQAVDAKIKSENITKVLYPNDQAPAGKELRLKQQYFFVTCSLQDMIRLHLLQGRSLEDFSTKFAVQLNDTHPAIAVAELMRLLVDVYQMGWDPAWKITTHTFSYTNHTLLPEALEKWSVSLFEKVLPRHLELIYEINHRFILHLQNEYSCSGEQIARMSLIDESGDRSIRMAHLATVGSHKINGVSALHSELLKLHVFKDFASLWPHKFCNVTNGVTPRRFMVLSNPALSELINKHIGNDWIKDLSQLKKLEPLADDTDFQREWSNIKLDNKQLLTNMILERTGIVVEPNMLFDVQIKRIHEYKRQHLKVLHIINLYLQIKKVNHHDIAPSVFIFAGKAAPGYQKAKLIIKFITSVADLVNNDPEVNNKIKVVFLPNFNVKTAQSIYPAADLSEQISMAGMEASGTGNMKFSMNGALTIGTLDGANVEMVEEVGKENFFLFGLNAEEVQEMKYSQYQPFENYAHNPGLKEVLNFIVSGKLNNGDTELFRPIFEDLILRDPYLLLADYQSYIDSQLQVHQQWKNQTAWTKKSILNVARMGKFSSDRSIKDYCKLVWNVGPV